MLTLVVVLDQHVLPSLPAAARIANATGHGVALLCIRKDAEHGLELVSAKSASRPELVRAAVEAIEGAGLAVPPVYDCRGRKLHRAVINALSELEADQIILPANMSGQSASQGLVKKLLGIAPVDVVLVDSCAMEDPPKRILVPQYDGGAGFALRFAGKSLAAAECEVEALADPESAARSHRTFNNLLERLPAERREFVRQSEPSVVLDAAMGTAVTGGDLVLLDVDDLRMLPRAISVLNKIRQKMADVPFALAVTRAEDAVGPGRMQRAFERLRLHAPALTREQRRTVHQTLEAGGSISANFVVMLVLSASIASLGLIQSSPGVVIGAMLVAPLMTPLLAIGMSLVQGNYQLFRKAYRAVAIGIAGALLASMAIACLSPWKDLSSEVVARGSPNPFDLLIALLSGIAAAFALARPGLSGMLVGVAIAVALVPPLAAVGISTVKQHFAVAAGAGVMFLTNLFAIIFGAALVFRVFGLDASLRGRRSPRWVLVAMGLIIVAMIPVTGVLVRTLEDQIGQGVHRPYARPLPAEMRAAINERVSRVEGVQIVMMAESEIEHGFGREVVLAFDGEADEALIAEVEGLLRRGTDPTIAVRVIALRSASSHADQEEELKGSSQ